MAKARRNIKTHPKPRGDEGTQDNFVPPDRTDQGLGDGGGSEMIDVFGNAETISTGTADDDASVDMNSAGEGDARSMASEGDENAGDVGDGGGSRDGSGRRDDRGDRDTRQRSARSNDGDGSFSARTRARIARERALVNRERTLREQAQRELATERTARQSQDERLAKLERAHVEVAGNADVKAIEQQIRDLEPKIAAYIEAGNTLEAVRHQTKLGDLQSDLKLLKYDLQRKQDAATAAATSRAKQQQQDNTATDTGAVVDDPAVKELAAAFRKANRHWWNRRNTQEATNDAVTIDKEILDDIAAGELDFEPYTDEHLEELANRLHEAHPDLNIQDVDGNSYEFDDGDDMTNDRGRNNGGNNGRQNGRQNQGGRGGGAPVRNMGQGGRRGPNEVELARQGKVTLDDVDRATMRLFKMDPNNPVDKKYFAKEKARSLITGQRGQTNGGGR